MKKRNSLIYRSIAFEQYKLKKECIVCYSIVNICVHHKDENYHNNTRENLQILCKSCHSRHHRNNMTQDMKDRISKKLTGLKQSNETCRKKSIAHTGKVLSLITRCKLSDGQLWSKNHMFWKHHLISTKLKISNSLKWRTAWNKWKWKLYHYNWKELTSIQWAKLIWIQHNTLMTRFKRGWSISRAIETSI